MLNTLRATLFPSGVVSFDEPVQITEPTRVLVTLLDEHPFPATTDPLKWPMYDEDGDVWEELLNFRPWQPMTNASLEEETS